MIPIMPWGTLGDPLPYITGSYYKATTFVIENNVSPLEYIIKMSYGMPMTVWYFTFTKKRDS